MNVLIRILLCILVLVSQSCSKPEDNQDTVPRTIIVYMIASNSLGSYGYDTMDIDEMDKAVANGNLNGCRLLVYHVTYSNTTLFEIKNNNGTAVHHILKEYNKGVKSTEILRMTEVFSDMKSFAPANDYGLILWSHSTGWAVSLPKANNKAIQKLPHYRTFGDDQGSMMTLTELEEGIPDNTFSFIYCDACYLGGIEVAYQLRNKAQYFIGSPTLLPAYGMPYDKNIKEFCKSTANLAQSCENTYNYYNNRSGSAQTLTICLVKNSELDELASICNRIYASSEEITDISEIQGYIIPSEATCIFFDFGQYNKLRASEELKELFDNQLDKAVIYKASTNKIFNNLVIDSNKFSGLSSYILATGSSANENYYKMLSWYLDTHN